MRTALVAVLLACPLLWAADSPASRGSLKADPAATALLAGARAARARWKDFSGFGADIEVNVDGKVSKGRVHVDSNGKAKYAGLSKEAEAWVKPILGSIVGHRLDTPPHDTPCAFADTDTTHPLGRLIRVLNDEMHSGYRIRDHQILLVDRSVEGRKFTISVLENRKNAEGQYLPVSFVVDYWNPKTGELVRSDATFQTWRRIGNFDLPGTTRIITAERLDPKKPVPAARTLTLSNHALGSAEK